MVYKQDEVGNKIIVELYKEHSAIYIKLASESVKRLIGNVLFKERTLFVERNSAKHLMRKGNAYGFNHYILANAKQFDFVIMYEEDTKQYYRIEREYMLKEGKFMFFIQQLDDTLASLNDSIMQLQYLLDIEKNNIEKHKTKADEKVKRINNFTDDELLRFITKRYQR